MRLNTASRKWPYLLLLLLGISALAAPGGPARAEDAVPDSSEAAKAPDWEVATADLGPVQVEEWEVDEGTWMSLDISPNGRMVVFDLLGDLWTLPLAGGEATLLRGGRAWEMQPRFSPDGAWIAFTSDAGGGDNIWVMRADGSEARQLTDESFRLLNNPAWSPDGRYVVARKHFTSGRSLGAGEMWMYEVGKAGSGVQLTERPNQQKDVNEPEFSPDGRKLYYTLDATSGSRFQYNKDPNTTIYQIRALDLEDGDTETVISVQGGSVRPEISPDGKTLAYVRRVRGKSVLFLRDLATGADRPLFDGLSKDQQETWAIHGVYPGYAWMPSGREIVIYGQGKLHRVKVEDGHASEIPFRASVRHEITEAVRFHPEFGGEDFPVRVLRWPSVSPDGKRVVFSALGQLWVRGLPNGNARRLGDGEDFEYHPRWSPDSKSVVYVSWNDQTGGQVRVVGANGRGGRTVVAEPGHYVEPSWSSDGRELVYRRGGGDGYRGDLWAQDRGVYTVEASGGEPRRISESGNRPMFTDEDRRILLLEFGDTKTLYSIDRLGGDRRDLATSDRAMEMLLSPDGRYLAFEELWEVYVCPLPRIGEPVAVGPTMKNLPVRKLSTVAGEFLSWSADSMTLSWGHGPDLFSHGMADLFPIDGSDAAEAAADSVHLGWNQPSAVPRGAVVFRGGIILTMEGEEIIENGAVRVEGNRITHVGPSSEVPATGAEIVELDGRVLMPGLVDIHAHMGSSNSGMHSQVNWAWLANLSFGVTTTHDPSNNTRMVFAGSELVEAGLATGPRVFSTGTILYGAEGDFKAPIDSREDARRHLGRLQRYGSFSAKSYNQPRREQRQWVIREARDLGMMVVPEGGSTAQHNFNMILDGHTTIEHAIPLAPLHEDVLQLITRSGTAYTPTLVVGYGGWWGENYWYMRDNVWEDERLLRWVPRSIVDSRSRRRLKVPADEHHHLELAKTAAEIVRRGGVAELGAHGQRQGVGVHWEMWMFGMGGLTNHQALQVGTILGARSMGLDHEIGSIKPGKLADLIVLDANPLNDLENSREVAMVMADGFLHDARTLERLAPNAAPAPRLPQLNEVPEGWWMGRCLPGDHRRH